MITKIRNILNQRKREKKIKHILMALPPRQELEKLGDPLNLPSLSLFAACQRFILGAFEDCVLHSAFALELALTMKLDEVLENGTKQEIRGEGGLGLAKAIKLAREKELLVNDLEKAWTLHNLRNMFAHPGNWLTLIKRIEHLTMVRNLFTDLENVKTINHMPKVLEELKRMKETLAEYVEEQLGRIPELEWAASQDTLVFQHKRQERFFKEITEHMFVEKGLSELLKHSYDPVHYIRKKYPYTEMIGLEALEISFDLLQKLKTLPV